jgi:hypothetical protein
MFGSADRERGAGCINDQFTADKMYANDDLEVLLGEIDNSLSVKKTNGKWWFSRKNSINLI